MTQPGAAPLGLSQAPTKAKMIDFQLPVPLIRMEMRRRRRMVHTKWPTYRYKKGWIKGL